MRYIELGPYELIMWLLYITAGAFAIYLYKAFFNHKKLEYLLPAYFLKIFGGFIFAMIYVFYYSGTGDTIEYFFGSKQLADFFWDDPMLYLRLLNSNCEEAQVILKEVHEYIRFSLTQEEWFMLKIVSPFNILGLQSYLGVTYFMSFISFLGSYKMYQLMVDIMDNKNKNTIFIINFLIPSVLFWGSGLLKDTITLSSFSFIVFFSYQIVIKNKYTFLNFFFIIVFSYIIFNLKAYILICFLIWILISIFLVILKRSTNPIIKFLLFPYLIAVVIGIGYFGLQFLLSSSDDYNQEILFKKVEGFQTYHATLGGSVYSLGEVEYTEMGLLKKMPQAINVSLFRPYPWESKTVLVLINSLESLFLFFFMLYVLFKYKLSFFKNLKNSAFLIGALVFCLLFSFFIGITSYNFGALSRFKIPMVALFFYILYYIYNQKKENHLHGLK